MAIPGREEEVTSSHGSDSDSDSQNNTNTVRYAIVSLLRLQPFSSFNFINPKRFVNRAYSSFNGESILWETYLGNRKFNCYDDVVTQMFQLVQDIPGMAQPWRAFWCEIRNHLCWINISFHLDKTELMKSHCSYSASIFCMRTHSKAFSLREAKGCCATFFSSMGGGSDLGTTSADQDSICGYLSGDYVCRKPRKISQISPPPSLE